MQICWPIFFATIFYSCSHRKVNITSPQPLTVHSQPIGKFSHPMEKLGELPLKLDRDSIKHSMLRLAERGKATQYWFFPNEDSDILEIEAQLTEEECTAKDLAARDPNLFTRTILGAYKLMIQGDFDESWQLAEQAERMDVNIAGPLILKGLIRLKQNKNAEAQSLFTRAKALDPKDQEIDVLLKMVKK